MILISLASIKRSVLLFQAQALQRKGLLLELVDPNLGAEFNKEETMVMLNVALLCTSSSPIVRPSMSAVVSMLEGRCGVEETNVSDSYFPYVGLKHLSLSTHGYGEINSSSQTRGLVSTSIPHPVSFASSGSDLYPIKLDSEHILESENTRN